MTWNSLWRSTLLGASSAVAAIVGGEIAIEFAKKRGWIVGSVATLDSVFDRLRPLLHVPWFRIGAAFFLGLLVGSLVDWTLRKFDGSRGAEFARREAANRQRLVRLGIRVAEIGFRMRTIGIVDDRLTDAAEISNVTTVLDELHRLNIPRPEGEINPRTNVGARRLREYFAALGPPLEDGNLELAREVYKWSGRS